MKRLSLLLFLAILPAARAAAVNPVSCAANYASLNPSSASTIAAEDLAPRIGISPAAFDEITARLRKTLSGNLATVLRSEWKAKGAVAEANKYVSDLAQDFLTPETRALVTKGLNPSSKGYIRTVAKRLFDLAEEDKKLIAAGKPPVLKNADLLGVRDPAPPAGASDYTFTYYTRPVGDDAGGKHQIRVRNYLRVVNLKDMQAGVPVNAFASDGSPLTLVRGAEPDTFQVIAGPKGQEIARKLSLAEVRQELGANPTLYAAPHGGKFKLEVKTRLKDSVSTEKYPALGGQNLVQKLDVSLSAEQVGALFAPLPADSAGAAAEANARLKKVKEEVLAGITMKEKK
ncbi:MAG: hypothetical protein EOP11_18560, partial [Proteobacteria bacterium]